MIRHPPRSFSSGGLSSAECCNVDSLSLRLDKCPAERYLNGYMGTDGGYVDHMLMRITERV